MIYYSWKIVFVYLANTHETDYRYYSYGISTEKEKPYRATVDAGLSDNAIKYILEEKQPKCERLSNICEARDLELYIGEHHRDKNLNKKIFRKSCARKNPCYAYNRDIDDAENMLVPQLEVRAIVGRGATVSDECPVGMLAFWREWICKHNIQPGIVSAIEVKGDSMELGL